MNKEYVCRTKDKGNEKHKVLLVYPKVGADAKVSLHLPASVLYPASYLKDFSVCIYDQRVDKPDDFERLLKEKPVCVGFSVMTGIQIKFALELAKIAQKHKIPTVFGGVHPTILPEQTLEDPRVDYVVRGDGETALRKIVVALSNKQHIDKIVSDTNVDLDKASDIPYDFIDVDQYVHNASLEGRSISFFFSRGCPFQCTFCCNPVISKCRWQTMSMDVALKHLDELVKRYKLDGVTFFDENLTVNPKILSEFAKMIDGRFKWFAQSRMNSLLLHDLKYLEKMGAYRFSCGIESGSDRILKLIKKQETVEEYIEANRRLAKTNINVWYNYIIGFPTETMDDLKDTIKISLQILEKVLN